MGSKVSVENDIYLSIGSKFLKLRGFNGGDSRTGLFVEPVDHELFGSLPVVFDLLSVAEVDKSGEARNIIASLYGGVSISINFGKTH